jgi:pyruvate dehydrogenase E2 component (dihydrolipoamide acetyltransferase)
VAKEHGIDISTIKGSGLEGRTTEKDVMQLIKNRTKPLPRIKKIIQLHGFRKTSAERVSTSFKTAPHSAIMMEVDMSKAEELHKRAKVSYTAIIAKIVADSLEELPWINSTFEDGKIKIFEDVNIGIAVATKHGLVVPVIHNCNRKELSEVATAIEKLLEKAQQEKLSIEDLTQGTFTVTSLGMYGVDFFTPIINPPEAAILGVGRIVDKPVAISGKIEIKPILMLSLSYDHRIVDGAPAAEFLQRVKMKLEKSLT